MSTTRKPAEQAASEQSERRRAVREILKPSPVRLHHVPNWLRLRMLRTYGCSHGILSGWAVLHHATGDNRGWLDHCGSTLLPNGQRAFVSEPYGFSEQTAADLNAFCRPMGLRWSVKANSEWFPGSTVRIVIYPPEGREV